MLVCLLVAQPLTAQTWDLAQDFALDKNPNGPWAFGWKDKQNGEFVPYNELWGTQEASKVKGFFGAGWFGPVRAWCSRRDDAAQIVKTLPPPGELYYPDHWVEADFSGEEVVRQAAGLPSYPDPQGYVGKNTAAAPFGAWGYFWEPEMVLLMPPGNQGDAAESVVRWTSPVTGRVSVAAQFTGQRIQGDGGTLAQVHVRHGKETFTGHLHGFAGQSGRWHDDALGPTPVVDYAQILDVDAGDVLEFAVGTEPGFNRGVFGVQNKQVLPGVGLAVDIALLPSSKQLAQQWVDAKFTQPNASGPSGRKLAVDATPLNYGAGEHTPPFSFVYDGRPFLESWESWKLRRSTRRLDATRVEHTVEFIDAATGLVAKCVGVEYQDFPTVEWTLYLKNGGVDDSPLIENVQALDLAVSRRPHGEFALQRVEGEHLIETPLRPGASRRLIDPFPYFNLSVPGGGLILAVSWPGSTAVEFNRDQSRKLVLRAGQTLSHFRLKPGEEFRSPMIVLQFWPGERRDSQNVWRRWMIAHNMPRPGGKQLPPQRAASSAYQFGNMVKANEENQKQFIDRYIEERLKPDYWWMDAGWYPPNKVSGGGPLWGPTGTWEPDRTRFPHGLRAISDYAHARNIGTILWCQPERASPGTALYLQHPEFLLGAEGADKLLDFGDSAAWKWASDHFSQLVSNEGVDIYRQDMNIDPTGFWQAHDAPERVGISENRHVVGYFAYLDELQKRNPNVRLDHFRVDLETLRRAAPLVLGVSFDPSADQCHNYRVAHWIPWHGLCSRAIDEYSFRSMICPAIVTGWDLRRHDLDYGLARRLVEEWERVAPYFLGDFYPLTPYTFSDDVWMAWQFDRPEAGDGIVQAFRRSNSKRATWICRLYGLDPKAEYEVTNHDGNSVSRLTGAELRDAGLTIEIPRQPGATIVSYRRVKNNAF